MAEKKRNSPTTIKFTVRVMKREGKRELCVHYWVSAIHQQMALILLLLTYTKNKIRIYIYILNKNKRVQVTVWISIEVNPFRIKHLK